ncbi:MAG: hypothetical protein RI907_3294 [Pseudomonadota bacterium]|jgi:uncharacterized protein YfaP (DUF2135 family)
MRRLALSVLLLTWGAGAKAEVRAAELHGPRGGWMAGPSVEQDQADTAQAYPYNLINRGSQKHRTLIRGRLVGLQDTPTALDGQGRLRRVPYKLVVNGNPMPLYTGDDGRFVRPYAFDSGSNSIELKGPPGQPGKRVQFHLQAGSPTAALRVILSWDDPQAEVDLHVLTPDGQHAFFGNPVLLGGGGLDVDSVDGAGPEMFSVTAPKPGVYQFYVNYWGNFGEAGYHFDERTRLKPVITARLTVVTRENTPNERRQTLVVPLRKIGDLTWVQGLAWR